MKLECLQCGNKFEGRISKDDFGWHSICDKCGGSFDVDVPNLVGKTVCVSFEEIYKENGAFLQYGDYIDFYNDGENDYYDVMTPCLDGSLSKVACDGESFEVQKMTNDYYVLKNCVNGAELLLSNDEYSIGAFETNNFKLDTFEVESIENI